MTTRMLRAGLLGMVFSTLGMSCDGRTYIGSAGGGTGGTTTAKLADAGPVGNPTVDPTTGMPVDAAGPVVDATGNAVDALPRL